MVDINSLQYEAERFRGLLDNCNPQEVRLISEGFPVMNCKLASLLLSFHLLTLWPNLEITGVGGEVSGNSDISHFWLEIDNWVLDITGDQYNLIDDIELNPEIIRLRPFQSTHVAHQSTTYLYELFEISYEYKLRSGFSELHEDFIENMVLSYAKIIN